jgi:hypothetical protein
LKFKKKFRYAKTRERKGKFSDKQKEKENIEINRDHEIRIKQFCYMNDRSKTVNI